MVGRSLIATGDALRRKLEPCVEDGWYVAEGAADRTRRRASRVKIVDVRALIISP